MVWELVLKTCRGAGLPLRSVGQRSRSPFASSLVGEIKARECQSQMANLLTLPVDVVRRSKRANVELLEQTGTAI